MTLGGEVELMELVHGIALWALIACAVAVAIGLGAWVATTVREARAHATDSEQRRGQRWES